MYKVSPYIYPGCYYEPMADGKQLLPNINLADITYTVCNRTGISLEQVRTAGRCREIADTRHMIYYLADKHLSITPAHIGIQLADNRHRTTYYHAIEKVNNMIDSDKTFKEMITRLSSELKKLNTERFFKQKAA